MASGPRIPISGVLLIVFGALFLFDQLGMVAFGRVFTQWWPLLIIVAGALRLIERPAGVFGPILMITAGSALLLAKLGYLRFESVWRLWPLVLIAMGLNILFSNKRAG